MAGLHFAHPGPFHTIRRVLTLDPVSHVMAGQGGQGGAGGRAGRAGQGPNKE